jgi:L-lactate permease
MTWQQAYDPMASMVLSTVLAAVPVVVMLVALGLLHIKAHIAAGLGLVAAIVVAVLAYGMSGDMAGRAAVFDGLTGLMPIGWIGVAMAGTATASNVLFSGRQKVAAAQLSLSPNLMGVATISGGVMGNMIDAQSIVVAATATRWFNDAGDILRYVFFHSIGLAWPVGLLVTLQA